MTRRNIGRRGLLKMAGLSAAAGLSLPLLRPLAASAGETTPKRLVVIFTANGTLREHFWPGGTDLTAGRILEPLRAFRDRMLLLKGLNMESRAAGPGNGHTKGMGHILTGAPLLEGDLVDGMGRPSGYAGGISVDQRIAGHIGGESRIGSLVLGVRVRIPATPVRARLSYRAANEPLVPNDDPYSVASLVFGEAGATREELLATWARRESILDHATAELNDVRARVGTDDRLRIDAHLQSVRELERTLAPDATVCDAPMLEGGVDPAAEGAYPRVSRMQMDLITSAFRCDVSRVASVLYSSSQSGQRYPWLGVNENHHTLSHEPDSNTTARNKLLDINRWHAGEIAYLLEQLGSFNDPDGTSLLDNTLVVWCNEMGTGNSHSSDDLPFVLAGGGAGFRMGRQIDYGGRPHNDLLVSLCNAYGIETDTFGDDRFCNGPLDRLT